MSRATIRSAELRRNAAEELTRACMGCCTGAALRAAYDRIVAEPVPQQIRDTLRGLESTSGRGI